MAMVYTDGSRPNNSTAGMWDLVSNEWGMQVVAITSSLAFGWLIHKMQEWILSFDYNVDRAPPIEQNYVQLSPNELQPLYEKIIQACSSCCLGLAFGSMKSLLSQSPLPLVLGPILCAKTVTAKATQSRTSNTLMQGSPGTLKWSFPGVGGITSAGGAFILNDDIVLGESNGMLFAISNANGQAIWTQPILMGSPVIAADNVVYFAPGRDSWCAFNATTGQQLWRFEINTTTGDCEAVVSKGVVYVSNHGWLYAISAATGQQLWNRTVYYHQRTWIQAVVEDRAFVLAGAVLETVFLAALNTSSGKTLWHLLTPQENGAFSNINIVKDTLIAMSSTCYGFNNCSSIVFSINASTGKIIWKNKEMNINCPVINSNMIIGCNSASNALLAIETSTGSLIWQSYVLCGWQTIANQDFVYVLNRLGDYATVSAVNITTGQQSWSFRHLGCHTSFGALACTNMTVYFGIKGVGTQGNSVYALDSSKGKILWNSSAVPFPDEPQSITIGGDLLYLEGDNIDMNTATLFAVERDSQDRTFPAP